MTHLLISYCQADQSTAQDLASVLEGNRDLTITMEALDPPDPTNRFDTAFRHHDCVIQLVSRSLLASEPCMAELLRYMKDDAERERYLRRTIPVIITSPEVDLFSQDGQLEILDDWISRNHAVERQIMEQEAKDDSRRPAPVSMRARQELLQDVSEHIVRFLRNITQHVFVTRYAELIQDEAKLLERIGSTAEQRTKRGPRKVRAAALRSVEIERLKALDKAIVVASHDDPEHPEFPPFGPSFPATRHVELHIPEIGRSVLIKDESRNPTGSHKDRMAWEVVVYYKSLIRDLISERSKTHALPAASIISNGSAARAIQHLLAIYKLPALRVLMDVGTSQRVIETLEAEGCVVYIYDLSQRVLSSDDVLELTENAEGFDLTSRALVDPAKRTYYDWLSYEILNIGASHIFVPVGTGDLFVNLLAVLRDEVQKVANDARLQVEKHEIQGLTIYGATANDPHWKLDKLYAKWRPTLDEAKELAASMVTDGICKNRTGIYGVKLRQVTRAIELAKANDINCEGSGIAGLALFLEFADSVPAHETVLVVNTGRFYISLRVD